MMTTNKLAIALVVLGVAALLGSAHPTAISKGFRPSGNMVELKGTALVVVKDFRDEETGRQWCEVFVEMVGTKMGEKREGLDVDVVRVDFDENMSKAMHRNFKAAPFVSGDSVRMVVEKDASKPGVYLMRDIKSVEASKATKLAPDGHKTVLNVVVNYQDENSVCDAACVSNNMYTEAGYNVNEMYGESSYGVMSLSGDIITVTRPVNLAEDLNDDLQVLIARYNPLIVSAGFNPDTYDMVHYHTKAIGGLGLAFSPGREGFSNSIAHDTIAHEMGHNFGFQHSGEDTGDDGHIEDVYNDLSCTMGYQVGDTGILRNFNVLKRLQAGWLPQSQVFDLAEGACANMTLSALVTSPVGATNPHAIRANRDGTLNYYVSYRADSGYDGNMPSEYKGVTVHHDGTQADDNGSGSSAIVASLSSGEVFQGIDFVVTVHSMSETSAGVSVCSTGGSGPCDNDGEGLVALARQAGSAFDFVVGCDGMEQYCTGANSRYVRQFCPTTCGGCAVNDQCVFDDNNQIAVYAAAIGQPSVTNCSMAAAFLGPTACTGRYASTMQATCPCQC